MLSVYARLCVRTSRFRRLAAQPNSIVFDCAGVAPICLVHQQHLIRRARRMEQSQLESLRILSLSLLRARPLSAFINWRFIDVCISNAQRVRIASSHSVSIREQRASRPAMMYLAERTRRPGLLTPQNIYGCIVDQQGNSQLNRTQN